MRKLKQNSYKSQYFFIIIYNWYGIRSYYLLPVVAKLSELGCLAVYAYYFFGKQYLFCGTLSTRLIQFKLQCVLYQFKDNTLAKCRNIFY